MRKILLVVLLSILSGCVSQSVKKVSGITAGSEICIVKNNRVSRDFFDAYSNTLRNAGFTTKEIAAPSECEIYTTYTAHFGQHWGLYLSRAQLDIYKAGKSVGSATYKAPRADPSKHGRVEGKIQKLVDEMFGTR